MSLMRRLGIALGWRRAGLQPTFRKLAPGSPMVVTPRAGLAGELVGRELQLEALAQVRRDWEAGRPAAVALVGEKGSGKSALLQTAPLEGLPRLRIRLGERIREPWALRDLVGDCHSGVIEVEGIERLFLRTVGGFEAVRELQCLLAERRRALWIVALNQPAWRLLKSVLSFQRSFTHQVSVGGLDPAQLGRVILSRPEVYGLGDLEALHLASGGLVSSALHLFLNPHSGPRHAPDLESALTLAAILQHDGLSAGEHAQVFGVTSRHSQLLLNGLELEGWLVRDNDGEWRLAPHNLARAKHQLHRMNLA